MFSLTLLSIVPSSVSDFLLHTPLVLQKHSPPQITLHLKYSSAAGEEVMMCLSMSPIFASKLSGPRVIARITVAFKLSLQNQAGFKAAFTVP